MRRLCGLPALDCFRHSRLLDRRGLHGHHEYLDPLRLRRAASSERIRGEDDSQTWHPHHHLLTGWAPTPLPGRCLSAPLSLPMAAQQGLLWQAWMGEPGFTLWNHRPITDFWRVGTRRGITPERLAAMGLYTMGGVAYPARPSTEFWRWQEILIGHGVWACYGRHQGPTAPAPIQSRPPATACRCAHPSPPRWPRLISTSLTLAAPGCPAA